MKSLTKKDLALSLKAAGRTVEEIAKTLQCSVELIERITDSEAFGSAVMMQNRYAKLFNGILRFKTLDAARESVARLDALYEQFVEDDDVRGIHQAQLMALIGKNRCESQGKIQQADLFAQWLHAHMNPAHYLRKLEEG